MAKKKATSKKRSNLRAQPPKKSSRKAAAPVKSRSASKPMPAKREQEPAPAKSPLKKKELEQFKQKLQALRDRVIDEIGFLTGDNLNRSQRDSSGDLSSYSFHMADQGTDNFDREFALNLASSEQDTLYEIDEALARIEMNTFGICEMCGCAIEKTRLQAMPYAKMCIKCKAQSEKGKARYRPFGPTLSQTLPTE